MSHKCKGLITYDDTRKTEGYEREFVFVNLVLSVRIFKMLLINLEKDLN